MSTYNDSKLIIEEDDKDNNSKLEIDYGKCCFCNEECNIHSQSCGKCAREMTMTGFTSTKKLFQKTGCNPVSGFRVEQEEKKFDEDCPYDA